MTELVELSAEKHADLRIAEGASLSIAAKQHLFNLRAYEIGRACSSFPVFITRNPQTGDLAFSAMCSFEPGTNLFVRDDQWDAVFVPSAMQTYPLFLMQAPDTEKGYAVGIDEASAAFSHDAGNRLYENGKPTELHTRMANLLESEIRQDAVTRRFLSRLQELDLIRSMDVKVQYASGQVNTITGLNSIDEGKLSEFTGELLEEFHKSGYLLALHALLVSSFQLNGMIQRQSAGDNAVVGVKMEMSKEFSGG